MGGFLLKPHYGDKILRIGVRNLIRNGEWSETEWRILLNWLSRILTNTAVSGSGEHPRVGYSQKEVSEKLDSSLIKGESLSYSTVCNFFFSSTFHIFSLPLVFNSLIIKWLEPVFCNFSYWASCIRVFEERFCLILSLLSFGDSSYTVLDLLLSFPMSFFKDLFSTGNT